MFLFVWSLSVHLWHRHTNSGENFYVFNQSIFQLSDIEEWPDTDTDQHMLQLDVLLVSAQLLKDSSSSKTSYTEDTRGGGGGGGGGHSLGLGLSICDLADEDGVLWVADVSLLVHVGGGDCEHGAIIIEGQRGDAGRVPVELTQALLVEGVPDVHKAV